ncbi:MAG: glycosyltransferase, partial [Arenicellales bacterium]
AYTETEMDSFYTLRSLAQTKSSASRLSQQLISYLPHHVRCDIYSPPEEINSIRDIDVLLVGRCHKSLYPLRARWARLVHENRWTNAVHFAVPYGLKEKWTESERIHQQQEYANLLSRARIVLSCSSHWRYMLGKFTEIAASGSFLISDVPTHLPIEFSNNMGIVSNQMSDSELIEVVNYWLNNTQERERRTNRLGVFVRGQMDMRWFWKKVDDAVLRWKQAYTSGVRISV